MKVAMPLAKNVLAPLGLTAAIKKDTWFRGNQRCRS